MMNLLLRCEENVSFIEQTQGRSRRDSVLHRSSNVLLEHHQQFPKGRSPILLPQLLCSPILHLQLKNRVSATPNYQHTLFLPPCLFFSGFVWYGWWDPHVRVPRHHLLPLSFFPSRLLLRHGQRARGPVDRFSCQNDRVAVMWLPGATLSGQVPDSCLGNIYF